MTTPDALRDEGMAAVENASDPRVMLAIDAAIARANASGRPWSANDIRDELPVSHANLVGARVRAAAARRPRVMKRVDYEPSTLESTHGHPIAVWVGVHEGACGNPKCGPCSFARARRADGAA